jgi:Heparinase II/III-like protein/Heparinase II/III N-terminus
MITMSGIHGIHGTASSLGPPRPLWCVIERERRDLEIAAAARAGRFFHNGVWLDLGRRPDWVNGGLPQDEEWRIEWVKLYEGLDLAHAFKVTGDPELLLAWEDLVESFCDQVPVGHDSSDVSARRMQNWLYAWARFAEAPGFSGLRAGLAERLAERIRADAEHLAGHLTAERNHRTLELYTLLIVSLTFDPDREAAQTILNLLGHNAIEDVWADGVHRECSTDYHMIVLRSLLGAVANGRSSGGMAIPPELLAAVERACDFAMHAQRPDGITPAFSDGDQGDFRGLLADAARVLDRADLAWVASGGTQGAPPAQRLVSFEIGGYHVQRSGWGEGTRAFSDERFALFDCGPIGDGGHGHYDQLSVELAGGGHALVVDPGRYTYAEPNTDNVTAANTNDDANANDDADADANWRHWFKGTAAHNTVTVDGLDQTPYRPGKPKGPTSAATLLGRWTTPGLDVLTGQVSSPSYAADHRRTLAFVDDDFWVVHDRLRGQSAHTYVARWHLSPEAHGHTSVMRDHLQTTVSTPEVSIIVPRGCGEVTLEDGWVSPRYGVKLPAPVVVITAANAVDADLVTVILVGNAPAVVTARRWPEEAVVIVNRPGIGRDLVRCGPHPERLSWRPGTC